MEDEYQMNIVKYLITDLEYDSDSEIYSNSDTCMICIFMYQYRCHSIFYYRFDSAHLKNLKYFLSVGVVDNININKFLYSKPHFKD